MMEMNKKWRDWRLEEKVEIITESLNPNKIMEIFGDVIYRNVDDIIEVRNSNSKKNQLEIIVQTSKGDKLVTLTAKIEDAPAEDVPRAH